MSTASDIAAAIGGATTLVDMGIEVFKAAKAQADAPDDAAADAAREARKQALMQVARETQRQLLEFELDK